MYDDDRMEKSVVQADLDRWSEERITQEKMVGWAQAVESVWNIIAYDSLVDECGEPDETVTLHRDEAFDLCCDAPFEAHCGLTQDEVDEFRNRDRSHDEELKKLAFPYETLGW